MDLKNQIFFFYGPQKPILFLGCAFGGASGAGLRLGLALGGKNGAGWAAPS